MCLQHEQLQQLNNCSFIFDEPRKPKLSTRLFVHSAKINLNKYWNKLEKIVAVTSLVKKNKKKLRKLKIVNQQLLNNRVFPAKVQQQQQPEVATKSDEIYGFVAAKFPAVKPPGEAKTTYKPFIDDSLYGDMIPMLMTTESKMPDNTPCVIDKAYDNYNFCLNEFRQQQQQQHGLIHNHNDNAFYIQQLNESLRRKGYKFTLADVDRCSSALENMYYKGQYLEDEGYLV